MAIQPDCRSRGLHSLAVHTDLPLFGALEAKVDLPDICARPDQERVTGDAAAVGGHPRVSREKVVPILHRRRPTVGLHAVLFPENPVRFVH